MAVATWRGQCGVGVDVVVDNVASLVWLSQLLWSSRWHDMVWSSLTLCGAQRSVGVDVGVDVLVDHVPRPALAVREHS